MALLTATVSTGRQMTDVLEVSPVVPSDLPKVIADAVYAEFGGGSIEREFFDDMAKVASDTVFANGYTKVR